MASYSFKTVEEGILKFWEENEIHSKARKRGQKGKIFYFLDGPPYTSGRVHIGTSWNKSLKDMVLRYKRMKGFNVWDRAGYDMHGMPTEQGVEKELGIKNKDEILKMGIGRFTDACREFCLRNMAQMNKDFQRLGVWMDFENAYQPIKPEYIEGEWWLIKKAYENKRLYEGEKTMHWCSRCATALAKHELEYKQVSDESIFLKFPVIGKHNEFLIIWTTTPWTIPFNLGVMANPDVDYVRAKVGEEIWILAKTLAEPFIQGVCDKQYSILTELKGEELKGMKYRHPLYEELKEDFERIRKESGRIHEVVMSSEYVDVQSGTGLVHMAPGCGPEDYEVGHREGFKPYNTLSEQGEFGPTVGKFKGWVAKRDDKKFVEALAETGLLVAKTRIDHDYAHCWRCKQPIVFRTTTQWFFRIEDLKERMRELNKQIKWVPQYAGSRHFDSWISNLRDNGITRQRFWGTPLPVWKCDKCGEFVVVGSIKELKDLAGRVPEDFHKPWIDDIKWACKTCDGIMCRSPDIMDVWIDAGSASWNCLDYPQRDDLFNKMFPADFILEGIDQIRGWFNLLFVASMISMDKPSFKAVYMHGFVQDSQGRKMSKSLGNYILPEEVVGKYGADTLRYYMIGGTPPGQDISYNFDDMRVKHKNLMILWNLHNFVIDLAKSNGLRPEASGAELGLEERFIISRLNSTIRKATNLYDNYELSSIPALLEQMYLDLSRVYVQLVRDKTTNSMEERQLVLHVTYKVLLDTLKMMAPIVPFITEEIYQSFRREFGLPDESIHLLDFPESVEMLIDEQLESDFLVAQDIIQSALSAREKMQVGLRWPVKEVYIVPCDKKAEQSIKRMEMQIRQQINARKTRIIERFEHAKIRLKPNLAAMGPDFGEKVPSIIAHVLRESPSSMLARLNAGNCRITVEGTLISLKREHFNIETELPPEYISSDCKSGVLYIDRRRDADLDAEGYAREIMRRVQNLRKKEGLSKQDRIRLCVTIDKELEEMLSSWKGDIEEKVGASSMELGQKCKGYGVASQEKVKDKIIGLCIEKI